MIQSIIDLLAENGINITISENLLVYGFIAFVIVMLGLTVVTKWNAVKATLKQIVVELFKEFKYDEETLGIFYDNIVAKVKEKLKVPDKNGNIPKINKWVSFFLSLPLTKSMVIKQIKYYLDEIVKKCQEQGIDVNEVLDKNTDSFEVPNIK